MSRKMPRLLSVLIFCTDIRGAISRRGLAVWICMLAGLAQAGQMQISPVLVEIEAPASADSLRISNQGDAPLTVQMRLFGWRQQDGEDIYFQTQDVVVSPPIVEIAPGKFAVVRIVRRAESPLRGEEPYRLFIDQLPDVTPGEDSAVSLLIRHAVPVFFFDAASRTSQPAWTVRQQAGQLQIGVVNHGLGHIKLSALTVSDSQGRQVAFGEGLIGYVLGNSSRYFAKATDKTLAGPEVQLSANSNIGRIEETLPLSSE